LKQAAQTIPMETGGIRARLGDFVLLSKPRISLMVAITALVGFYMGATGPMALVLMGHLLIATMLTSAGASVLNQYLEREIDAYMRRTQNRPLPARRLRPVDALVFGTLLSLGGTLYMLHFVNALAAVLAALTIGSYAFLYTPAKRVTVANTLVGAVPGALPPMGGWVAARGEIGPEGWALFAILFAWQLPHFYAIAWMYREEYARAGLKMLSVADTDGTRTARRMVGWTFVLTAVSVVPTFVGLTGWIYFAGALALGVAFGLPCVTFVQERSTKAARAVLLASVLYLPCLLLLMALDKATV